MCTYCRIYPSRKYTRGKNTCLLSTQFSCPKTKPNKTPKPHTHTEQPLPVMLCSNCLLALWCEFSSNFQQLKLSSCFPAKRQSSINCRFSDHEACSISRAMSLSRTHCTRGSNITVTKCQERLKELKTVANSGWQITQVSWWILSAVLTAWNLILSTIILPWIFQSFHFMKPSHKQPHGKKRDYYFLTKTPGDCISSCLLLTARICDPLKDFHRLRWISRAWILMRHNTNTLRLCFCF